MIRYVGATESRTGTIAKRSAREWSRGLQASADSDLAPHDFIKNECATNHGACKSCPIDISSPHEVVHKKYVSREDQEVAKDQ